jgi:hypothetical protein
MESVCKFYELGNCKFADRCKFLHQKSKRVTSSNGNAQIECQLFLEGKCNDQKCSQIHNHSLKFKEENNKEFAIRFNTFSQDYALIEPFEAKVSKKASLDLMFIIDCSGSMSPWIQSVKNEIKNIINFIYENNSCSQVRLSFICYRDFYNAKANQQYEIFDFNSNVDKAQEFISKVQAIGNDDDPEDVCGGLNLGLKQEWKSNARYAILIADMPCHGSKYHNSPFPDNHKNGDPNGLILEDLVSEYARNDIFLYMIKITEHTNKMFKIMSDCYQEIAKRPIHIENLGNNVNKLSFFVGYSASVTLGSVTNEQMRLQDIINAINKESITEKNEELLGLFQG